MEKSKIVRMANVGIVVEDLKLVIDFFLKLGLELEGEASVEGEWVDRIVDLKNVKNDIAMMKTPDDNSRIELIKFHSPKVIGGQKNEPVNTLGLRRIMFEVEDIKHTISQINSMGFELLGEEVRYGDSYILCYIRGPEGIIVALAQKI